MNVNITFRHLEHTPALDELIRHKSEKFTKWFGNNCEVNWTCWVEGKNHCAEVKLHAGHEEYFAKGSEEDMYKTIDSVVAKIQNQVK